MTHNTDTLIDPAVVLANGASYVVVGSGEDCDSPEDAIRAVHASIRAGAQLWVRPRGDDLAPFWAQFNLAHVAMVACLPFD